METSSLNHRDVLCNLAVLHNWKVGAELGCGSGLLTARLLAIPTIKHLIGVDLCQREDRAAKLSALVEQYGERFKLLEMSTFDAAEHVADSSLDFVFIDAGHSYEAAKSDIERWPPKVKPKGWFGGHDYHEKFPGVIKAVHETFGDAVTLYDGFIVRRLHLGKAGYPLDLP